MRSGRKIRPHGQGHRRAHVEMLARSGRGASASPPPGQVLVSRSHAETVLRPPSHTGGEVRCVFFTARNLPFPGMPPLMAEAIAEVMRRRFRVWGECPKGTRPAPAPPPAGASLPPGPALPSRSRAETVLRHPSHRAGKTRCVFVFRPRMEKAIAEVTRKRR